MRKFALKGLIALAVIVLICIFFSGTLHTITTAKVQLAGAKSGRFETKITMTGSLYWPKTAELLVEGMGSDDTLTVSSMNVSAGSFVRAGDVIAICDVNEFDSRLSSLRENYAAKEKEYLEQERKNSTQLLSDREKEWFNTYQQLQDAVQNVQTLRQDLHLEAWKHGITLGDDDLLPEGAEQEELLSLSEKLAQARKDEAAVRRSYSQLMRFGISDDTLAYLEKKAQLEKEMKQLNEDMMALRMLQLRASSVTAPWDGYITAADLKPGDQVSRGTALVTMTAQDTAPVIRLNPRDNKRVVTVGTPVSLSAEGQNVDTVISGQGVQASGSLYLEAELKREHLTALGGVSAISESNSVTGTISWRSENPSTLVPSSALRGTEGDYYVYIAQKTMNSLGAEKLTVVKKSVTVLGISGNTASVQEELRGDSIIYMEDRTLTEGCEVIPYGNP